jgi:hypothetical protein
LRIVLFESLESPDSLEDIEQFLNTNGLGIIRHITFCDDHFKQAHPEMWVEKN